MLLKRTIAAGETDVISKTGKNITLLRIESGCRLALSLGGVKVIDTEVHQGMSLSDIRFDQILITSQTEQLVELWAGDIKFTTEPDGSKRPATFKMYKKHIPNGVNELLNIDLQRTSAKISGNQDMYIGGDNLENDSGEIKNGLLLLKGEQIELTAYGKLLATWTDKVGRLLAENLVLKYVKASLGFEKTNSDMVALGVPYIDLYYPDDVDGVALNYKMVFKRNNENDSGDYSPRMLITVGSPDTEALEHISFFNGTGSGAKAEETHERPFATSSGPHRIFFFDYGGYGQTVDGEETSLELVSMEIEDARMSEVAEITILEERL
ncbi:hypothetical protein [uncultured Pseudoalteromonas sp.]|uniref:hypothetical protein n=1 Tax=uncultured Pseudoalteromonas sp. TaxID=114053 RepID=UPI0030FCC3FB